MNRDERFSPAAGEKWATVFEHLRSHCGGFKSVAQNHQLLGFDRQDRERMASQRKMTVFPKTASTSRINSQRLDIGKASHKLVKSLMASNYRLGQIFANHSGLHS